MLPFVWSRYRYTKESHLLLRRTTDILSQILPWQLFYIWTGAYTVYYCIQTIGKSIFHLISTVNIVCAGAVPVLQPEVCALHPVQRSGRALPWDGDSHHQAVPAPSQGVQVDLRAYESIVDPKVSGRRGEVDPAPTHPSQTHCIVVQFNDFNQKESRKVSHIMSTDLSY